MKRVFGGRVQMLEDRTTAGRAERLLQFVDFQTDASVFVKAVSLDPIAGRPGAEVIAFRRSPPADIDPLLVLPLAEPAPVTAVP